MKLVALDEGTVQFRSQAFAHAGLAATRHPHDNDRALELHLALVAITLAWRHGHHAL